MLSYRHGPTFSPHRQGLPRVEGRRRGRGWGKKGGQALWDTLLEHVWSALHSRLPSVWFPPDSTCWEGISFLWLLWQTVVLQAWWPEITEMYSLTGREAGSLKSVSLGQNHGVPWARLLAEVHRRLCSWLRLASGRCWHSLAGGHITPLQSASALTLSSLLSLSSLPIPHLVRHFRWHLWPILQDNLHLTRSLISSRLQRSFSQIR